MERNAIVIHPGDNVAIAVRPIRAGERVLTGRGEPIVALDDVPEGHKVALAEIGLGQTILKYGHAIGVAAERIPAGRHVHTWNLKAKEG